METKKKVPVTVPPPELLTINQILDKFDQVPIDAMSAPLGRIRQNLINDKRSHPKGGLIKEPNTQMILFLIEASIKNDSNRTETAAHAHAI
jgi:hypothetical protein